MLKSAIGALAVSAAALLTFGLGAVTATPSFAAAATAPVIIGSPVSAVVSCPGRHLPAGPAAALSRARDSKQHRRHHARRHSSWYHGWHFAAPGGAASQLPWRHVA